MRRLVVALPLLVACSGSATSVGDVTSGGDGAGTADGGGSSSAGDDAGTPNADAAGTVASGGSGGSGGAIGASVALPGCTACALHVPPGYAAGHPAPLLVSLHGDEGPASGVPSVIQLWGGAADKHGYLLLALACSSDLGCADGNWSNWLAGQGYQITAQHMATMNAQAQKVESLYDVDTKREYLSGYSGGAYVLGYFAQAQAARYAAVAFVAGGMPAWTGTGHPCPTPKIPGYFLGGDGDYRTAGQMSDTASSFKTCGEEVKTDLVTGADHQATIESLATGRADAILAWFDARPLAP